MSITRTPKTSFSAGEVSPVMSPQIETEIYQEGLSKCENYMVDLVSGVLNRPSTQYIDDAYNAAEKSRLLDFEFNEEQAYALEFGDLKMRILKDGGLVGAPTEVVSPYSLSEIGVLNSTPSADVLFLFHPDHKIGEVVRTSDTVWDINPTVALIRNYPWKPREIGDENIRVNLTYIGLVPVFLDDEWQVEATSAIFGDTEVGDSFKVGFTIPGDATALHWKTFAVKTVTSDTILRLRTWDSATASPAERTITYQQIQNPEFNDGLNFWKDFSAFPSVVNFNNTNQSAEIKDGVGATIGQLEQVISTLANRHHIFQVKLKAITGTSPTASISIGTTSFGGEIMAATPITDTNLHSYDILPTEEAVYINIETTGSTDNDVVEVEYVSFHQRDNNGEFNTTDWRLTAWNANHGYPSVGVIDGQRLICASSPTKPQTIWVSELANFRGFDDSTPSRASDGFSLTAPTKARNGIRWIIEKNGVKLGTAGAVWSLFAPSGGVISPTDVAIEIDHAEGSLALEPVVAHNAILMTPQGKSPVLEMVSSLEAKGFGSRDVGTIAEHLFRNRRIVRWAFAKDPYSVVWVILDNGQLLGFTYHRHLNRWAWHKHTCPLGAGYADVVVIPNSSDDNIDDVYFLINRGTVGSPNYYIEIQNKRITPQDAAYGLSASGSPYDYRFLDSALTVDDPKIIDGISKTAQAIVAATGHGFSDGDDIRIQNAVGMIEVNNQVYTVSDKTASSFKIKDSGGAYIDSTGFTTYVSGGEAREMITAISGLDHLEGSTVTAIADGAAREDLVVTSGAITLPQSASFVHVGLPYVSEGKLLDTEAFFQSGSTQGRKKSISSVDIYFNESRNCKVFTSDAPNNIREVQFEDEAFGEEPPPLYDGVKEVDIKSSDVKQVSLSLRQDKPYPSHITRAIIDVDYSG